MNCEKSGADESGLAIFKIKNSFISEESMLASLKKYFQQIQQNEHGLTVDFVDKKNSLTEYEFTVQGSKHQGSIETKKCPSSTVGIFFQEAKDDHSKNKDDFEKIMNSFTCS